LPSTVHCGALAFDGSGVEEICLGSEPADPSSGIYAGTRILQNVKILCTATMLPASCFEDCLSLVTVTFEAGSQLTSLPQCTFSCSAIQFICIPQNVREIGDGCFSHCQFLSIVTFEIDSRLASIGEWVFSDSALSAIAVPASVPKIGTGCFHKCKFLSAVTFETGSQLQEIKAAAFSESPQAWVVLPNGKIVLAADLDLGWRP
jgi:hypothetical protein